MTNNISNIIDLTNAPTPPRWFEFLLEPGRLQNHLETPGCDPSPTQLMTLFFRNIPIATDNIQSHSPSQKNSTNASPITNGNDSTSQPASKPTAEDDKKLLIDHALIDVPEVLIPPDSYEAKYRLKKAYALQILALKVASFLEWDLDVICNNLTIPVQYKLFQALTRACSSKNCSNEIKQFADVIYWHWFIKSAMTYQLSNLQLQSNNTTIIYLSQLQQQQQAADNTALSSMGDLFTLGNPQLDSCASNLHVYLGALAKEEVGIDKAKSNKRMKTDIHPFDTVNLKRPTMNCFDFRHEEFNEWDKCVTLESRGFLENAAFDLGKFFFFGEEYGLSKQTLSMIDGYSNARFPMLSVYVKSICDILEPNKDSKEVEGDERVERNNLKSDQTCSMGSVMNNQRLKTEKYLFDCMTQFSKSLMKDTVMDLESDNNEQEKFEKDSDLRFEPQNPNQNQLSETNAWYQQVPPLNQQQMLLEAAKGDVFMSQGDFKQAMGCFVGALMLMTDYFRFFSKNYLDEEPYISRMIQCSISLSCFTQAVALCQMSKNLNYTIAFKQLNERVCNDCCDDIYECIWNVTLLEYIINLHSRRGEVERRTRVIQLVGQLELNENNPEEILKEAEHVRRGRFFRIMSNKYL